MKHNQKKTERHEKIKRRSDTELYIMTTKKIENIIITSKDFNMINITIIIEIINHIISTYLMIEKKTS